jgi:tol-pal system protein YbgF
MAVVLTAAVAAPAAAVDKEHRQLAADLRVLQEQSQQLQNVLNALTEALKTVNARLDQQAEASRKALADQKLVIDNLSSDVRVIREKLDDNNVRVSSLAQEIDALRQSVQQAMIQQAVTRTTSDPDSTGTNPMGTNPMGVSPTGANPSGAGPLGAGPTGGSAPGMGQPATAPANAAVGAPGAPVAVGTSPTKLYDAAYADYTAGQWDLAILGFESFIRTFPRSDAADNAQVNIGNAYLQNGKYDKAVEEYDRAIRTYPNGDAVPEAFFKKGLALQNLRDAAGAREAWDFVIKTFPDSTAAIQSKQRLEQLRRP